MPTIFVHIQQRKKRLALHIKSHLYVTYIVISLGTKTSKRDHMPTITSRMQQSKTNLARCVAVTTAAYIPFSHARHKGITAPRHFNDYSSSNATRRAAHSNTICWRGMWEAQARHPSPFQGFLAEKGQKSPQRAGMTSLGSPGLSSQSASGFSGRKGPNKNRKGLG